MITMLIYNLDNYKKSIDYKTIFYHENIDDIQFNEITQTNYIDEYIPEIPPSNDYYYRCDDDFYSCVPTANIFINISIPYCKATRRNFYIPYLYYWDIVNYSNGFILISEKYLIYINSMKSLKRKKKRRSIIEKLSKEKKKYLKYKFNKEFFIELKMIRKEDKYIIY
ncbi:MAG: hypothetical protein IRZ03_18955 [Acidobacterium ailaaui]|nr:hypothetical protein [Pseudacidobacterium ailaaui]